MCPWCPYVPMVVINAVGLFLSIFGGAKVKQTHEKVTVTICNFFVAVSSLNMTGQVLRQRSL